jgi:hypothetical protein
MCLVMVRSPAGVDLAQDAAEFFSAVSPAEYESRAQEADEGADRDHQVEVVGAEQWRVVMHGDHTNLPGLLMKTLARPFMPVSIVTGSQSDSHRSSG